MKKLFVTFGKSAIISVLLLLFAASFVHAVPTATPTGPLPTLTEKECEASTQNGMAIECYFPWARKFPTFGALVSTLLPNILVFAGIVLMMYAIVGGFMLMRAGSAGNADQAEKGKKALTYGVVGFVIVFSAYFIIELVEFVTGIPIFGGS